MGLDVHECRACLRENLEKYSIKRFEFERNTIHNQALETIQFGKSNFILVISDIFVGSIVVKAVLNKLEKEEFLQQCQVIQLNGTLYDTDDMAFRAIAKRLNCGDKCEENITGNDTDFVNFVIKSLREASGESKPLIFILENFDVFCDHEKQFLYHLFDVMNLQQAPIFVVGISENNNCMEKLLERTKSRSSNDPVVLFSNTNFENRLDTFRSILSITEKLSFKDRKLWNKMVNNICKEPKIEKILNEILIIDQTEELFINFMRRSISYVQEEPVLNVGIFEKSFETVYNFDSDVVLKIKTLSILELCLLISIYHHCSNINSNLFNFELVYGKYFIVARRSKNLPRVDRILAFKAFQTFIKFKMIVSKESGISETTLYQFVIYELVLSKGMIYEVIKKDMPYIPLEVKQWIDHTLFYQ